MIGSMTMSFKFFFADKNFTMTTTNFFRLLLIVCEMLFFGPQFRDDFCLKDKCFDLVY